MGVVVRKDSPYYWLNLERAGLPPLRQSTRIPVAAPTPAQRQENKRLAEAAYAAKMGDLARQRFDLPANTRAPSLRVWAQWYQTHVTPTKRSANRERSAIRTLVGYFGRYELQDITPDLVMTWRRQRLHAVKWTTVNRETDVLKSMVAAAVPKYLKASPLVGMQRLRAEKSQAAADDGEIRVLERDEELRLLEACETLEDRVLIVLGLDSLIRLGDLVLLTWKRDKGGYLLVANSKNNTHYKTPISKRLRKLLDQCDRDDPRILAWCRGRVKPAQDRFTTLCRRAGLPVGRARAGLTFHCLRHTGATRLVEAGINLRTVQAIGGWKDLRSVMRYAHPTGVEQAAVDQIGARPVHGRRRGAAGVRGERR